MLVSGTFFHWSNESNNADFQICGNPPYVTWRCLIQISGGEMSPTWWFQFHDLHIFFLGAEKTSACLELHYNQRRKGIHFFEIIVQHLFDNLLGQWLIFELFGITFLVGKISRSNFHFRVPGTLSDCNQQVSGWWFFTLKKLRSLTFDASSVGLNYTIQLAPFDCTGCAVCVELLDANGELVDDSWTGRGFRVSNS